MKLITLLAATAAAIVAVPATAKPITYTFTGAFGGTLDGNAFANTTAIFTGKGDTANTGGAFGYAKSSILGVPLTSLTALASGVTFTITSPAFFYIYDSALFGTSGDRLGLGFDNSGVNALGLQSTAFDGYDGLGSFATTAAPTYYSNAQFTTDRGAVTINSFAGGTFAAAVPETATWAMMIGGFGLVGGAMRRRGKVRTTVSFA